MTPYSTPLSPALVLRHLHWLCQAPSLITGDLALNIPRYLPADLADTMSRLRSEPTRVMSYIDPDTRRLGHYFEHLYHLLLEQVLGWQVLARNLPVRTATGHTLGELDFIVRNPQNGQVEHHEIAVKFYLGLPLPDQPVRWYGPDTRDRLDRKVKRLLQHQATLCQRPEALAALNALTIPAPECSRVFMPGYLFYPDHQTLPCPEGINPAHERGDWQRLDNSAPPLPGEHWIPLSKTDWLSPYQQMNEPRQADCDASLALVETRNSARLFARLAWHPSTQRWVEQQRRFVVPADWASDGPHIDHLHPR
ncbi:MAG: DUF1853 family protein [Marinobacter sp.]|nr:DUF1853 family protein [Marinobacter sp.]